MKKNTISPSTLDGIKRLAKRIKAERGLSHSRALDEAAREGGFENFIHARRRIDAAGPTTPMLPAIEAESVPPGTVLNFHRRSTVAWDEAVASLVGAGAPTTVAWTGRAAIAHAMTPFMGRNRNHAHLPTGGGVDFHAVSASPERGCLDFAAGAGIVYRMRPRLLTLERIEGAPGNSFLLLELDELEPTGIHGDARDEGSEDVIEVRPGTGRYVHPRAWERGFIGYDGEGREIPLPDDARTVARLFRGKILLVAKGSLWNGDPGTYDGRHDGMTSVRIRRVIERSLEAAA